MKPWTTDNSNFAVRPPDHIALPFETLFGDYTPAPIQNNTFFAGATRVDNAKLKNKALELKSTISQLENSDAFIALLASASYCEGAYYFLHDVMRMRTVIPASDHHDEATSIMLSIQQRFHAIYHASFIVADNDQHQQPSTLDHFLAEIIYNKVLHAPAEGQWDNLLILASKRCYRAFTRAMQILYDEMQNLLQCTDPETFANQLIRINHHLLQLDCPLYQNLFGIGHDFALHCLIDTLYYQIHNARENLALSINPITLNQLIIPSLQELKQKQLPHLDSIEKAINLKLEQEPSLLFCFRTFNNFLASLAHYHHVTTDPALVQEKLDQQRNFCKQPIASLPIMTCAQEATYHLASMRRPGF